MLKNLALCAACLVAGPALAGGPIMVQPDPEPTPAPATVADFDWTGFYIGAMAGNGEFGYGSPSQYTHYGVQAGYLRDFGTFVVGGEIALMKGDQDSVGTLEFSSTRLKLIGGLSLGRVLPYGFAGVSKFTADYGSSTVSDTFMIYGVGARFAVGASGRHVFGVEYLVEKDDDFNGFGGAADNSEISIRYDFRF